MRFASKPERSYRREFLPLASGDRENSPGRRGMPHPRVQAGHALSASFYSCDSLQSAQTAARAFPPLPPALLARSKSNTDRELERAHPLNARHAPEVCGVHNRPQAAVARRVEDVIRFNAEISPGASFLRKGHKPSE